MANTRGGGARRAPPAPPAPPLDPMVAMYVRLSFTLMCAQYIVSAAGESLDTLEKLLDFKNEDVDKLASLLRKPGGVGAGGGPNPGHSVSMVAIKSMKLAVYYIRFMFCIDRPITPADVTIDNMNKVRALYSEFCDYKDPDESSLPKPKQDGEDYVRFHERAFQCLNLYKGNGLMFLSAFTRPIDTVVKPSADDPSTNYLTVRDELHWRADLETEEAQADNATLSDLFQKIIGNHPGRVYCKPFFRRHDGRGAWFAFFDNYLSTNSCDLAHARALNRIQFPYLQA